jgi:hypothetical protein
VAAATGRRTFVAVLVAMLLVGTAGTSVWLMASSGVLSFGGNQDRPGAPGPGATLAAGEPIAATGGFRVSPPRDPFVPLITVPTSTVPPETSSTTGGETTTTGGETTTTSGGGSTTSTTGGGTTTTTSPDTPVGKRVTLLEIRDEGGVRQAVLTVDGVTYTVKVGDTFADDFKVISLGASSGVFMYRDSVFTLAVGQSIIK